MADVARGEKKMESDTGQKERSPLKHVYHEIVVADEDTERCRGRPWLCLDDRSRVSLYSEAPCDAYGSSIDTNSRVSLHRGGSAYDRTHSSWSNLACRDAFDGHLALLVV